LSSDALGDTTVDRDFTFAKLQTDEDLKRHLELMRAVFGNHSKVDLMVKKWIEHHPDIHLKNIFVFKKNGKIVASLVLVPSKWSLDGVILRVAELGCVATLPEHRHKGLQSLLMKEYHKEISDQNYDLSAIEGIPYYYRQFGYEYALPLQEETELDLEHALDCPSKHKIRPFKNSDLLRATNLLENSNKKFFVHTIRDKSVWHMQQSTRMIGESEFEAYAVEENGKMVAYFRVSEDPNAHKLVLREITDVSYEAAQSVFAFLKATGKKRGLSTLSATVSYHEPFAEYLTTLGGVQRFPYGWQLRITNIANVFKKTRPLFERRLEKSMYRDITESVKFNFYRSTVQLTLENGIIKNVEDSSICDDRNIRMNPLVFAQLLVGHRSREELETIYSDFMVKASHKRLVDILFPKSFSYIHTDI
jgi:predicted acetyltransferase